MCVASGKKPTQHSEAYLFCLPFRCELCKEDLFETSISIHDGMCCEREETDAAERSISTAEQKSGISSRSRLMTKRRKN